MVQAYFCRSHGFGPIHFPLFQRVRRGKFSSLAAMIVSLRY
jgi:hypothetical protein